MNDKKNPKYFVEEMSLPLQMSFLEPMPVPQFIDRFSESKAVRSTQYTCGFFYKHISRPLPIKTGEPDE